MQQAWSTARRADAVPTATSTATQAATQAATEAATQASLPSRVVVRWYQLAVIVLGLALAAVTALAIYLAVNHSTVTASPTGTSGTVHSGTVAEHPCFQPRVPC
jgi:hypothetical protein